MIATQQIALYDSLTIKYHLDATTAQDLIVKIQYILDEKSENTNGRFATKEDLQQLKDDIERKKRWEQSDLIFYAVLYSFLLLSFILTIFLAVKK